MNCSVYELLAATSCPAILHVNLNHPANHPPIWQSSSKKQQIIVAGYNKDPEHCGFKLTSRIFCIA